MLPIHIAASCILLAATFLQKAPALSFRCVSFSAKGHACCGCSLVNALTTLSRCYQPFAGGKYNSHIQNAESLLCGLNRPSLDANCVPDSVFYLCFFSLCRWHCAANGDRAGRDTSFHRIRGPGRRFSFV